MSTSQLPTVITAYVIRSTHQGQSHGGVYLVDLETESARQLLTWDQPDINWEGRGGDRGLRGIAFDSRHTYLAASDEVFIFDQQFRRVGSITNPYLRHCHEICIDNGLLYLTSTYYDSILVYDLEARRFIEGFTLRFTRPRRWLRRAGLNPRPAFTRFDPLSDRGPHGRDTTHLNSITVHEGRAFIGGVRLPWLMRLENRRCHVHAPLPPITHNAQPFRGGLLMNNTGADRIELRDRDGRVTQDFEIPKFNEVPLSHADLPADHARPGFGRGLCVWNRRYLIGGSSPATISVYDVETGGCVRRINLSMDVRNAIHGLEVWPWTTQGTLARAA